jgi:uncharacterized protein (DUF697 family)
MVNSFNLSCDIVDQKYDFNNFNFEKLLSANATMIGIVNNILYIIDAFGKQFKSFIKLGISVAFFFSFGKISCKTFNYENKSIPSKSKKLSCFNWMRE